MNHSYIQNYSNMGCHWRLARQCYGDCETLADKLPVAPEFGYGKLSHIHNTFIE